MLNLPTIETKQERFLSCSLCPLSFLSFTSPLFQLNPSLPPLSVFVQKNSLGTPQKMRFFSPPKWFSFLNSSPFLSSPSSSLPPFLLFSPPKTTGPTPLKILNDNYNLTPLYLTETGEEIPDGFFSSSLFFPLSFSSPLPLSFFSSLQPQSSFSPFVLLFI